MEKNGEKWRKIEESRGFRQISTCQHLGWCARGRLRMYVDVTLRVPQGYTVPEWFGSASPELVGDALALVAKLVPYATREMMAEEARTSSARVAGMEEGIAAAMEAVRKSAEGDAAAELERVRDLLRARDAENADLKRRIEGHRSELSETELRVRREEQRVCENRTAAELQRADAASAEVARLLRKGLEETVAQRDALRERAEALESARRELELECAALRTPSGRGLSGEANVSGVLREAGYRTYDTSTGALKDAYLDILAVLPEGESGSADEDEDSAGEAPPKAGLRLAVEVKNRQTTATRDIAAFQRKVRSGVKEGLFDGGMFISLRSSLPGGRGAVRVTLEDDASGRPHIPVVVVGTEKRSSVPMMAEQIEVLAHSAFDLIRHTKAARAQVDGEAPLLETEAMALRGLLDAHTRTASELFADFNKQESTLAAMRKSLDSSRVRVLLQHRQTVRARTQIPWLSSEAAALPWDRYYEHAMRLFAQDQRIVWSNVTNRDAVINAVGREAATTAIMAELKDVKETAAAAGQDAKRRRGE